MSSEWATCGPDLLLRRDPALGRREGLERALRDAVRDGRLPEGLRLPSTRALARDLGLARGTVLECYAQLVAEGFLTTRRGSGTRVAAGTSPPSVAAPVATRNPRSPLFDLHPGSPDVSAFPRTAWLRSIRTVMRTTPASALAYGEPHGHPDLRRTLAEYLRRARDVTTTPELMMVVAGFGHGLTLLARALRAQGARRVAMEDPCIPAHREGVRVAGLDVIALPVDEHGARTDLLPSLEVDAVVVAPAHQSPLGVTLSPKRRAALVAWAQASSALVIEDDYDAELRYDRQPIGAVQSHAPQHVAYVGTASKTLGPGLRLGWMALPPEIHEAVCGLRQVEDRHCPVLEQLTLADLIASGSFERHLRRQRIRYRARRGRMLEVLNDRAPEVQVVGIAAGVHALLRLPDGGATEQQLLAGAARRSIGLHALAPYWHAGAGRLEALLVGYGAPPEHNFEAALTALGELLAEATHRLERPAPRATQPTTRGLLS